MYGYGRSRGDFFLKRSKSSQTDNPVLMEKEKLRRASPHWVRHAHATYARGSRDELTTARAPYAIPPIATTSTYLHSEEVKRTQQIRNTFADRNR